MSVAINISSLTYDQINYLENLLHMIPVQNIHDKKIINPIDFISIINQTIFIPYMIASTILPTIPNINNTFIKTPLIFTATLRDNQIPVYNEALEQLKTYGTTTLALDPGFGKTILGARFTIEIGLLTVVLMHRETLTTQWKTTYEKSTNAIVWIVELGNTIPPPNYNVIICMDTRWHKIPDDIRSKVGLLIIDEAHAFCTPSHVNCLLAFQPAYIIAESATLERDDEMHNMIYAICGTHGVYREQEKQYTVTKIITNFVPLRKMNRMKKTDWTKLVRDTLMNPRRNDIICNLAIHHKEDSILILTSLIDHVHILYNTLKNIDSCDYLCGNKKSYKDCRILIGTTHKLGVGFDQETFCKDFSGNKFKILILVCSIKKYSMLIQIIGRIRHISPNIIILVDSDPIYLNHWRKIHNWFKKRDANIISHNINQLTIDLTKNILL